MLCKACGTEIPIGSQFCPKCLVSAPVDPTIVKQEVKESKEDRIIRAKIHTRQTECKSIDPVVAIVVLIAGVLGCIVLFDISVIAILLSAIIIVGCLAWYSSQINRRERLQNEIKELEAGLE